LPIAINQCRFDDVRQLSALYKLLGDEARLRLLRVLRRERLNVTELTGVLGLAQSGVSRHLGLLKEAGLVVEERDAGYTYYRLAPEARDGHKRALWDALQGRSTGGRRSGRADDARLREVRACGPRTSDHSAGDTRDARQLMRGGAGPLGQALGMLLRVARRGPRRGEGSHTRGRAVGVARHRR
jgi:DNA-binding transcriptional ArsR family regulator